MNLRGNRGPPQAIPNLLMNSLRNQKSVMFSRRFNSSVRFSPCFYEVFLLCFFALLCAGPSVFTRKNRSNMHAGGLHGSAAEGSVKSMRMSHHVLAAFAFAVSVDLYLARRSARQRLNQTEQSTRPCPSLSVLGPIGADWKQQKSRPPAAGQPAVPATPWQ